MLTPLEFYIIPTLFYDLIRDSIANNFVKTSTIDGYRFDAKFICSLVQQLSGFSLAETTNRLKDGNE